MRCRFSGVFSLPTHHCYDGRESLVLVSGNVTNYYADVSLVTPGKLCRLFDRLLKKGESQASWDTHRLREDPSKVISFLVVVDVALKLLIEIQPLAVSWLYDGLKKPCWSWAETTSLTASVRWLCDVTTTGDQYGISGSYIWYYTCTSHCRRRLISGKPVMRRMNWIESCRVQSKQV